MYIISIFDNNGNFVYENMTNNTTEMIPLSSGTFLWKVSSFKDYGLSVWITPSNQNQYDTLYAAQLHELDEYWSEHKVLNVTPFAARKDTRLLATSWGNLADSLKWNQSHINQINYDEEESWRCWAVGINMLNHYYNGSLTQDEIKMHGFRYGQSSNISHLHDFALGQYGAANDSIINESFKFSFEKNPEIHEGEPSYAIVKNAIENGNPIYVSVYAQNAKHVMIIDGYGIISNNLFLQNDKLFSQGDVLYHFLNIDNNGNSYWIKKDSYSFANYRILESVDFVRNKDFRIDLDSDNDGIVDYDEIVRFGSNPYNIDSDDDGISDFSEIFAFTNRCSPYDSNGVLTGCLNFNYFDYDKDGLPSYLDKDSDNGGLWDGEEDSNKNGIVEANESDPFNSNDDYYQSTSSKIIVRLDIPDSITIYSIDRMYLNDRTICYDKNNFCNIASESGRLNYAINIGVQTVVKNIMSKGGINLRNSSIIDGNISIYSLPLNTNMITQQQSVAFNSSSAYYNSVDWPYFIVADDTAYIQTPIDNFTISSGMQYTLKDGDSFEKLKVESGGVLKIESGEIYIGSIQIESGAIVEFTEPGYKTIIRTNGKCIWRASIINENKELVAQGVKLIQYSSKDMFIEGDWAGTIFAKDAHLVMGQTQKFMYGRFLANTIVIHQNSIIYSVNFNPTFKSLDIALNAH